MSQNDISENDTNMEEIMDEKLRKKYCPMTETTFYTLLALLQPNHGYGIMKFVKELTEERVKMGTGTLYTMLGRLVDDRIIEVINEEDGKKTYQITNEGRVILVLEQERLKKQCENGERIIGK
jgi:DNA-binding PadR family transcriptional regulator